MLVKIDGINCVGCAKFEQFYDATAQAINHGFCRKRKCVTKPGNRCMHWTERSNVGEIYIRRDLNTCK